MNLTTTWQGRVLVATLKGELDMKHYSTLELALKDIAAADATGIVLNFSEVIYMASIAIGMLMKLVKEAKARGISVRLASPRPAIKMLLEMVRLESLLPMDGTLAESLQRVEVVPA
jgi:anti-sigma B factor antagonist